MTQMGRYEIEAPLGEGAMGAVYRARDPRLGRVVALKVVTTEESDDDEDADELFCRVQREAEAAGRLSHPNIVPIYDVGIEEDRRVYLAMELVEGQDLRRWIEGDTVPAPPCTLQLIIDVCRGLDYAHRQGVVHRDIKPANIMVTPEGSARILDFGLAHLASGATLTRRGQVLGTPDYMSPEQAAGGHVDELSDVFSAGAVFYELLTATKPFAGRSLHAVLFNVLQTAPISVLTLNPHVPARLAAVVERMLSKSSEARPRTLAEVAAVVEEVRTLGWDAPPRRRRVRAER
jgi:serine/threonine protein kinase